MSEPRPRIEAKNLTAQLRYRAAGNPPGTLPDSAISNCFPGLEFDFRNVWKRIFVGLEMHEADNLVVRIEDPKYKGLLHHRILRVACGRDGKGGDPLAIQVFGPQAPDGDSSPLTSGGNPQAAAFMEWSNALARVLHAHGGETVRCLVTRKQALDPLLPPAAADDDTKVVKLEIRRFFEPNQAVISREMVEPGELTQSLCSPWQNDYRECACYYWASSRPDYVNVEPTAEGISVGNNWMQKDRTPTTPREYVLDNRQDTRLVSYDDLFRSWETKLRFEIEGKDRE
jgi:hypothetical protein